MQADSSAMMMNFKSADHAACASLARVFGKGTMLLVSFLLSVLSRDVIVFCVVLSVVLHVVLVHAMNRS